MDFIQAYVELIIDFLQLLTIAILVLVASISAGLYLALLDTPLVPRDIPRAPAPLRTY
ncbi:MAG: hypothetical protein J0H38_14620 [Rhizobiales bacterium]|nr:hypothetical protein [Hyphomicrobiales bacterium]